MTGNLRSVAHDNLTVTVVHLASSCFILLSSRFVSFEVLLRGSREERWGSTSPLEPQGMGGLGDYYRDPMRPMGGPS